MANSEEYLLELDNITKVFPGVKALDNVSFKVKKGEVHALVGENGAGKSTLINIISGVFRQTEGTVRMNGQVCDIDSPEKAFEVGIGVVHQERNLIDTFNVAENICFMEESGKLQGKIDYKSMREKAVAVMKRIHLNLDPDEPITGLTSGKKQMIEIARAISMDSKILLLDEPTASISLTEANVLLETVKNLRKEGISVIYISHKLEEIFSIADSVTVIRDGKNIGDTVPIGELTNDTLIEKMVGRKQTIKSYEKRSFADAPVVIDAKEIASKKNPIPKSFQLKKGEILGWYGLVGAGRTEFAREIIGIDPITKGQLTIHGKKAVIKSYEEAFSRYNISYISENRKEEGLFLMHSIANNMGIIALKQIASKLGFINYKKQDDLTEKYKKELGIKCHDIHVDVASLSGGNQQKICIAKGLCTSPSIMIIDEPTVGIDVRTKGDIHELIYNLSQQGMSIIVISSDMSELVGLVDRIMVFRDNEIRGELDNIKNYDEMSKQIMGTILL